MEHELRVTTALEADPEDHRRGDIKIIRAEADLGPSPQLGIPESITGKLLGLTTEELLGLKFGKDVEVGFEGRGYKFTGLDSDGTFELRKNW